MNYFSPAAINCTEMGATLGRCAGSTMPQMPGRDVAGNCQRGHSAAVSLRFASLHPTQDRRHHDLHRRGEAIRRSAASTRHQNLPLFLSDRSEVSARHHDCRSRPPHPPQQQRSCRPTSSVAGPRPDSTRVRTQRHCGGFRMETDHRGRELLPHTLVRFDSAGLTALITRTGESHVTS